MTKPNIILIAAVGNQGQIGLKGKLPWHDPDDLAFFRQATLGKTVIVGRKTYEDIHHLNKDRNVVLHDRNISCEQMIERFTGLTTELFIAGGATTYLRWLPFVRFCMITRIKYDGPADTLMPSLWHDPLPALQENMQITELLETIIKRDLKVGNSHSVRLVGAIKNTILEVRKKKWPWLEVKQ